MSNKKVQEFLKTKEEEKDNQEIQYRYKVLSHYNLGETVYFKEGDFVEDFPLTSNNGFTKKRFRYDCSISDEDFEKVCGFYRQEVEALGSDGFNKGAEKTLNACAIILLIIGIFVFVITFIGALVEESWSLFGIGAGIFFTTLIENAFAKVLVNISHKLNKLG